MVEWRKVPGYLDKFEASNTGLIRSKRGVLKPWGSPSGYKKIKWYDGRRQHSITIHRLIAMTFLPNPNQLPAVNHKDGDKTNNAVDNLEWCTNSHNRKHAHAMGLSTLVRKYGIEHHNAKLNPQKVAEIRAKYTPRIYSQRKLATEYGVRSTTIRQVLIGKTWN